MDPDSFSLILYISSALALLYIFFTSAETAYLSLTESDKKDLAVKDTKRARRVLLLLGDSQSLFLAIRIASLFVKIALVGFGALLAQNAARLFQLSFSAVFLTTVFLFFAFHFLIYEVWSKRFIKRANRSIAETFSFPVFLYYQPARPLILLLNRLFKLSTKLEAADRNNLNPETIISIVAESDDIGALEENEKAMIHSIFEFGETEVHEIMVPRTDMICVEETVTLEELTRLISKKGHSRIPLYGDDVDHISGIIYAKDLLPYVIDKTKKPELKSLARPAYFVPESKQLRYLLKEFQENKYHMAIVVDEYGGTAGLVTFEDVIEEIVGDIQDEFDQELPLYRKLENGNYLVDAKIDLNELNDDLEFDLPTEGDYESLGGLILSLTGYVPKEQEKVEFNNYTFVIEKVDRNRILEIKLTRHDMGTSEKQKSKEQNE